MNGDGSAFTLSEIPADGKVKSEDPPDERGDPPDERGDPPDEQLSNKFNTITR